MVQVSDDTSTYFLNKRGVFDEQFLAFVNKQQYERATEEKIRRARAVSDLSNADLFPTFTVNLMDVGPKIMTQDFNDIDILEFEHPDMDRKTALQIYLKNIAISMMVGLAQGHEYNEGIFELPAPRLANHRLMTLSIRISNTESLDPRLVDSFGLFQIAIFMKKEILEFLPSFSSLERKILPFVKASIECSDMIEANMAAVKKFILSTLTEIVLYYSSWDPDIIL